MAYNDTKPDPPSHSPRGARGRISRKRCDRGYQGQTRKAGDATGINVDDRKPIDPRMPNFPPA